MPSVRLFMSCFSVEEMVGPANLCGRLGVEAAARLDDPDRPGGSRYARGRRAHLAAVMARDGSGRDVDGRPNPRRARLPSRQAARRRPGPVRDRLRRLAERPATAEFIAGVEQAALDPFRGYANAIRDELPDAVAVLDAFHVVRLGTQVVDEVRRRVQQATIGRPQTRPALPDLEAVMGPKRHPAGRLGAVAAEQHLRHRGLQIVVADLDDRRTTQHVERLLVALQERLLALGRVRPVDRLARAREPQREQETLGADPSQIDSQIREVDLGLRARFMGLRHERLIDRPAGCGRRLAT